MAHTSWVASLRLRFMQRMQHLRRGTSRLLKRWNTRFNVIIVKIPNRYVTAGSYVESVLARTEIILDEDTVDETAREMNTLEDWGKRTGQAYAAPLNEPLRLEIEYGLSPLSRNFSSLFACCPPWYDCWRSFLLFVLRRFLKADFSWNPVPYSVNHSLEFRAG